MNEYIKLDSGKILFSSIPKTPAVTPTEDYQVANKKYVDITETTITSSSTPTPVRTGQRSFYSITALAANATFGAPTGTPANGDLLLITVKDNGTARTLAFNAIYTATYSFAKPTTTTANKTLLMLFRYNSASEDWELLYVDEEV